ncbi:DNA adenine methylase [Nubsella zeaxanthinifaciens]|uniref:DNA adenine methylase n=1 Tax=Nubsella zeaxanthinifaciens TaxID=392412 RepID=UPI003CFDE6D3
MEKITPFLKWAGGKRWLTSSFKEYLPTSFNNYIEPFLGSGAVFFSLQPKRAILSDINLPLINTYKSIQADYEKVYSKLVEHSNNHSEQYYYETRAKIYEDPFDLAARFIYLNRTCFNAIYRVNRKGEFNVPKGSKNSVLLETDNFQQVSCLLKNTKIEYSDFEPIIDGAEKNDLIYVDPPYTVKHNNNGFVKYNEKMFTWQDQERLSQSLIRAQARGAKIIVSNADHLSIRELYQENCSIIPLKRSSVIASDPNNRGQYSEVIITF